MNERRTMFEVFDDMLNEADEKVNSITIKAHRDTAQEIYDLAEYFAYELKKNIFIAKWYEDNVIAKMPGEMGAKIMRECFLAMIQKEGEFYHD